MCDIIRRNLDGATTKYTAVVSSGLWCYCMVLICCGLQHSSLASLLRLGGRVLTEMMPHRVWCTPTPFNVRTGRTHTHERERVMNTMNLFRGGYRSTSTTSTTTSHDDDDDDASPCSVI